MSDELKKKMDKLSTYYPRMSHEIRSKIYELMEKSPKYEWTPYRSCGADTHDTIFGSRDGEV